MEAAGKTALVRVRGLLSKLCAREIPASVAETWFEELLRAGWIRLRWSIRGTTKEPRAILVLDRGAMEEAARPGLAAAREEARRGGLRLLEGTSHPVAIEIGRILESARSMDPDLLRALAAVGVHVDSGEVLSERVFSVRHLGDSKALRRVRSRLERWVGPLPALGIREGGAITLLGGKGLLHAEFSALQIDAFAPYLGLSRETLTAIRAVDFPAGGLFVVENLTAFEACCRGEVKGVPDAMIVWSAGYPGRGVHALVSQAGRNGITVHVWADLDLDGVRIARLVGSWAGGAWRPYRMSPAEVEAAPVRLPLSPAVADAIRRELEVNPDAPLTETLKALLQGGYWVEQEAFLGR
jgi:hypothetical protein